MFHNFNSSDFFNGSPTAQLACLNRAAEYVQLSEELERRFMAALKRMKQAFNLCSSSEKFSDEDKDLKIVCRYPQFFAANNLYENIKAHLRPEGDGKGCLFYTSRCV